MSYKDLIIDQMNSNNIRSNTHEGRLIDYLEKFGSITSLQAIQDLGNTRLSVTIYTLKKKGLQL